MQNLLRSKYLAPALLYVSFCLPTLADEKSMSVLGDIETVSIATGREQPIVVAPAVTTVFKSDDIKNTGARNLADLLNMVPGIHVGVSFVNDDPIYAVRGFTSFFNKHILIMIDGVPQDALSFGDRRIALGKIPIDIVERVEVSRGPGSALWGADAFSAVANIITKKKKSNKTSLALSGGSYDTSNARLNLSYNFNDIALVTSFEYSKSNGHEPVIQQDQQTLLDEQFGTNASLAPDRASTGSEEFGAMINLIGGRSKLGLRAYQMSNIGMGVGYSAALDPYGNIDNEGFEAIYQYEYDIRNSLGLDANVAYSRSTTTLNDIHFFPPGAFGAFPDGVILNEEHQQDFLRAYSTLRYSGLINHYMTIGIGAEKGEMKINNESRNYDISNGLILPSDMRDTLSDSVLGGDSHSRNLRYMYLQDEWKVLPDWSLTLGARYDDYSDFGSITSPRAVLVWSTTHLLTTKLLYGRGFRSPTFLETESRHLPAIEGNSELKPEKFDQVQLVFDYLSLSGLRSRLNFFYHETDDQIRQENTGGASFLPKNVGDQTGRGIELELWWDATAFTKLYSFYAYQDSIDRTTDRDAGYTPHHKIFASLQHELSGGLFLSSKATYIGDRDRIAEDDRSKADTYTFVDVLVRKKITPYLEATLEIRNIFDKEADEAGIGTSFPGDMPLPGRSFYFTFSGEY
jgi:iron complex outermembrane receptor protein